jgi:cytochrome bd-type quinol oxidase subunit 2
VTAFGRSIAFQFDPQSETAMTIGFTSAPSTLSLIAAALYGVVALLCFAAAVTAVRRRQKHWHLRAWLAMALLFCGFAILRVYGVEEALRSDLRSFLFADGLYGQRRSLQRPIAALAVLLFGVGVLAWIARGFRHVRGRRNVAVMMAGASTFGMVGLITLRLISLSPVDGLLYGPIKLNWIIDLGTSAAVMASAAYYVRLVGRSR